MSRSRIKKVTRTKTQPPKRRLPASPARHVSTARTRASAGVAFLLLIALLTVPSLRVFAEEVETSLTPDTAPSILADHFPNEEPETLPPDAPVIEEEHVSDAGSSEDDSELRSDADSESLGMEVTTGEDETVTDTATSTDASADGSTTMAEITPTVASTTSELATSTQGSAQTEEPELPVTPEDVLNTDEETVDAEELATSTTMEEDVASTTTEPVVHHVVTNDENKFSFGAHECVPVGDGSFYCNTAPETEVVADDRVFSAPDAGGDKEIFVMVEGEIVQLTENDFDDEAPVYDPVSERIVWHSLINDRFQVMSHSIEDGLTTQVTDAPYNNMEPTAEGDMTLWQAWIHDNWEIVMWDGETITQLTENTVPDIAPHIRDNYIIWQSHEGGLWQAQLYNRATGVIETIEGTQGSSVENPRFVLVYDRKDAKGDIETFGYDFESGEAIPLSATAAPVPERLPEPEGTGEERALVSPPTNPKTGTEDVDGDGGGNPDPDPTETASSSDPVAESADVVTLPVEEDVHASSTPTEEPEVVLESPPLPITESSELVIPPYSPDEHESTSL